MPVLDRRGQNRGQSTHAESARDEYVCPGAECQRRVATIAATQVAPSA